jgi:hypothetical protein
MAATAWGDDQLRGITREHKGADHTLAALKSIRAARPDRYRLFVIRNHHALARKLQACLRWRNARARHPGVLAAQRRERARIRSERQQRRGRPEPKAA